jgi:general stress protein 26
MKYRIHEEIEHEVEADSAQAALDAWLEQGTEAPGYAFIAVHERDVLDTNGNPQEFEDPL